MTRTEIAQGGGRKGSEVEFDKYRDVRDRAPGGMPGRLASTIHRVADSNAEAGGEPESVEQQSVSGLEMGEIDGKRK